ncbi:MAG: long-chain fatty acid--CoA ligase [Treponema sp.]|jgi:long-chain acyl-CoA synthetase|nr:long-chain fatty acid--CoA ligase [Treponema sp.]
MEKTLPLMLRTRAKDSPDINIQYYKDPSGAYKAKTYRQFYEDVCFVTSALIELGVERQDRIGLIADNRQEWMAASFAIHCAGACDVPRGGDVTIQELAYILGFTECKLVFAENQKQALKIISCKQELPALKTMITFDPVDKETGDIAAEAGITVHYFPGIIAIGQKREFEKPGSAEAEMDKGNEEDTASIIFTSGTTGEPKGVMLSHRNFLCQLPAFSLFCDLKPGDIWLSMLAVWHVYEREIEYVIFFYRNGIAYSKPVASVLMEDFQAIRPQWMASVPRVWEAIMDGITRSVKPMGSIKRNFFNLAVSMSMIHTHFKDLTFGLLPNFHGRWRAFDSAVGFFPWLLLLPARGIAQALVFNRIKKRLGGRFKAGFSGGGSLPARVDLFFNSVDLRLQEVYGLTETAPFITVRQYRRSRRGTIGQLLPDTEVRVLDANGKSLPPGRNGIIWARGRQVMKGYYKKLEATAAVLSPDGWFNTGDIGMLTHDNELRITGRAKDTIVLRGGENVEPVPIEHKMRESPYIYQCMVLGQDQKYLAALIVPRQEKIMAYAEENNIPIVDYELLLQQPEINQLVSAELSDRINTKTGFKPFERVFKFTLLTKPFEAGRELSAKQDLMRHRISALYAREIQRLFRV